VQSVSQEFAGEDAQEVEELLIALETKERKVSCWAMMAESTKRLLSLLE